MKQVITELLLDHNLHIALIAIGVVVMALSLHVLTRIRKYTINSKFEKSWNIILASVAFFLVGYAAVFYIFAADLNAGEWLHLILTGVFLAVALFVVYTLNTINKMLEELGTSLSSISTLRSKQNELAKSIIALAKKKA